MRVRLKPETERIEPKKMPPLPTYSMETIERARSLYRDGARVRDICAATGMSVGTLYHHLDGVSPSRERGSAPAAAARG